MSAQMNLGPRPLLVVGETVTEATSEVTLAWEPEDDNNGAEVVALRLKVNFGVLAHEIEVSLQPTAILHLARTMLADGIQPGEQMIQVSTQRLVRVSENVGGTIIVHDGEGLVRVPASDLVRPRTFAQAAES